MANRLIIQLSPTDDEKAHWLIQTVEGVITAGPELSAFQDIPRDYSEVIALIPGKKVNLTQVDVPATNPSKMAQAIPYALEEQLAEDIDDCHFAFDAKSKPIPVAIVNEQQLQHYIKLLTHHGIEPQVMLPTSLAVPAEENHWHVVINSSALVRTAANDAFAIDTNLLSELLNLKLQETSVKPNKITFHSFNPSFTAAEIPLDCDIEVIKEADSLLAFFAEQISIDHPLNLLQGKFRPKKQGSSIKRIWQLSGVVAALWLLLSFTSNVGQYFYYAHHSKKLQSEIASLYKQAFPNATSIVSPRYRIERRLKEYQSGAGQSPFLKSLAILGEGLTTTPVTLVSVEYRDKQLVANLQARNFSELEQLRAQVAKRHANAKLENATSVGKMATAKLVITS